MDPAKIVDGSRGIIRRSRGRVLGYGLIVLVYVLLLTLCRILVQDVAQLVDTRSYVEAAYTPLDSSAFWAGPRPFTLPLVYKAFGTSPSSVTTVQLGFHALSWTLLAACVARLMRMGRLKPVAFALVLLFSLSPEILIWNWVMLSESVSISLLAVFTASWLWLVTGRRWHKVGTLVAVAALWVFARDSNAWQLLMIAGLVALSAPRLRGRATYLALAVAFVGLFTASYLTSNVTARWAVPLQNVVADRVLPSPERTAYFAAHGMPVTPGLMEADDPRPRRIALRRALMEDSHLSGFRKWLYERGKLTYLQFLLSHPAWLLLEPVRNSHELSSSGLVPGSGERSMPQAQGALPNPPAYTLPNFSRLVREPLAKLTDLVGPGVLWVAAALCTALLIIAITGRHTRVPPRVLVALSMVALAYPGALVTWHGDSNELVRHALSIDVQLRLGLWLLILFGTDSVTRRHVFGGATAESGLPRGLLSAGGGAPAAGAPGRGAARVPRHP